MNVADRIAEMQDQLSPAERRAAQIILDDPASIVFQTVAALAERAGTSAPTVVRMASKLGFDGYVDLRSLVQEEMTHRLRPAADLIQEAPASDPLRRALLVETGNLQGTLHGVDPEHFASAVRRLADLRRRVYVLAAEAPSGIGGRMAVELQMLREGVEWVYGSDVRVARLIGMVEPGDAVLVMDLRRYDRWVLEAARRAAAAGAELIVLTDSRLSPYSGLAKEVFAVVAEGVGPFDSHLGTHALANALVAGVAAELKGSASGRLARVEKAWEAGTSLVDG